ncbi:jg8031 [Pararge aegeria aegeria]|uniref:Jg8031 protein n=1 Tax=Pararge aegeria aegeria TaxID=348720 RepID=A0A8S4RJ16_9NEOP|nr:jg8031 [Pararge aegeria aegeria]
MERSMLHVKRLDKIRNEALRKETNIIDVKIKIRKLKWKWADMCTGKSKTGGQKKLQNGIRGKGSDLGRQRIRWSDDFVKIMGAIWQRLARDRDASR